MKGFTKEHCIDFLISKIFSSQLNDRHTEAFVDVMEQELLGEAPVE